MLEKIYILNHPDFSERRKKIIDSLDAQQIVYELVDSYHPNEIDCEGLTKNYHFYHNIVIEQIGRYSYHNLPKKISPGSLSLVMKHIHCWMDQIQKDYKYSLILEDDCEIPDNFKNLIDSCYQEMNTDGLDIVMLGGFSDFISPNIVSGRLVHFHPRQKTRCTHAYMINNNSVKIMVDGFDNINNPIDIKMNEVIQLNKLRVGWLEPGLKQINQNLIS